MRILVFVFLFFWGMTSGAISASAQFVRHSTDAFCLLPSLTGVGMAVARHDRTGFRQLGFNTAACLAVNYGLEFAITKDRPDGTGHHAFPSTHAALAFNGATFLARRYGWKVGIPAYVLACYVGWGRVYADRHDWWDVLGGAALGVGAGFAFTRPLHKSERRPQPLD